jgi:hypothetical protein
MTPSEFIAKWSKVELTERSAAQQHFLDLCELLGHSKPTELDPQGEWFTFEKGVDKHVGGKGWADVWKRDFFGWEYKGKHKDLDAAYYQLLQYRESLDNPPLLVVCDIERIIVRTNFTGKPTQKYEIPLAELGDPRHLDILRAVFFEPKKLEPGVTRKSITEEAASRFAKIAQTLRERGQDPFAVARFLDRVVFCLFAEDVGLLPKDLFTRVVENTRRHSTLFAQQVGRLFNAMAHGEFFGADAIPHFNGNLFSDPVAPASCGQADADRMSALLLTPDEIEAILDAAKLDWSAVDASIFGTLFERGLDPDKRAQWGAHYTSRADIETLVEPVVMQPLRREWAEVRQRTESLLQSGGRNARSEASALLGNFLNRLASVKVLDPACGSGNFLYVTLQKLLDLEKEVNDYALSQNLTSYTPHVSPEQLYGIEINPYAFHLAQITIWIGYLQWRHEHGYLPDYAPILRPMEENFRCMDAILERPLADARGSESSDVNDPSRERQRAVAPSEPDWHAVDFIVGNPPFLGGKRLRAELGDDYVDALFAVWRDRVRPEADLCCYWFEKARQHIADGKCKRAGLLATQGIRGGANRETLKRIKETGDIFFAESDRPWILDGANVHVSMVGFDDGSETQKVLDGKPVGEVTAQLTSGVAVHSAKVLSTNAGLSFMGVTPAGTFDVNFETGLEMLLTPNPTGLPNSDVMRPYLNGKDLNQRPRLQWTIDFGVNTPLEVAARYEAPFEHIVKNVKPGRDNNRRDAYRLHWWLYAETRPAMRSAFTHHERYLATCMVAKHRIFVWLPTVALPANVVIVFARSDDYFFGVLHSRLHEVWALKLGTRLETRPRYTPTTCFETFPFPTPTPEQEAAIAEAARELNALRNNWLNPPEWTREEVLEFAGSMNGPWARYVHDADERGIGTVRYPRLVPKDADCAAKLSKRTLTNLYNQRPTWLELAHRKLDEAVFAAYGWDRGMTDEEILEKLLALNLAQSS